MQSIDLKAIEIRVKGLVQGVGFRPHVWHCAHQHDIVGEVFNDGQGVYITAIGTTDRLKKFLDAITDKAPSVARIDHVEQYAIALPLLLPTSFNISKTQETSISTSISSDLKTCDSCLQEAEDVQNRRYKYPFINCTHCGPRLSILNALPYDRHNTSMGKFKMCPDCQNEYDDPSDRRFHAQPNACPVCGPQVWIEDHDHKRLSNNTPPQDALQICVEKLQQGFIIAIKGIGGFHLVCDARNEKSVATLRARKRRPSKPFALMAYDLDMIREYCRISEIEKHTLLETSAPIVLLDKHDHPLPKDRTLASTIAPHYKQLGFMLPHSALHHFLLKEMKAPLVMTSANLSGNPQVISNEAARHDLKDLVDFWLLHDRDIVNRLDDSVLHVRDGKMSLIRRARGYAPTPLPLPTSFHQEKTIWAMGCDLKNTFTFFQGEHANISQYIGDLSQLKTFEDFKKTITLYQRIHHSSPAYLVHDHHPQFKPSQWAQAYADEQNIPLTECQHHHAHIAAVMGEYGLEKDEPKLLGIVLDGFGLSEKGDIWGGEFLYANYQEFSRLGHIPSVPLIGGDKAAEEPWRNLYAHLSVCFTLEELLNQYPDLPSFEKLKTKPQSVLNQMLERKLNCPLASSAGRLFDGVSALLDLCFEKLTYEGEAAILLEQSARSAPADLSPYQIETFENWSWLWTGMLEDLDNEIPHSHIAFKFHISFAQYLYLKTIDLQKQYAFERIVLSGGVFQNCLLMEKVASKLRPAGFDVLTPSLLPANDGAISFGQGLIAHAH